MRTCPSAWRRALTDERGTRLILTAGVDVAAGYQSAVGPVVFDVGAWIVATGTSAVVTGAMLLCTRRRTSTVVALMLPLVAAVLTLIELQ
ncbi:MAG TPA: hypothetical protein VND54_13490 [Candidatus Saccharimonadales bacterium]|nr:hypothetical protein [Candidatus Saccharimonadales bacterium]